MDLSPEVSNDKAISLYVANFSTKRPGRYRWSGCPYHLYALKVSASRPAKQSAKRFDEELQEGGFPRCRSFTCSYSSPCCCLGRSWNVVSMEVSLCHYSFNDLGAAMDYLLILGENGYLRRRYSRTGLSLEIPSKSNLVWDVNVRVAFQIRAEGLD